MQRIKCRVLDVRPFSDTVYHIRLEAPKGLHFEAGQYLKVVLSEEDKRPFSIASMAGEDVLELHLGAFGPDSWAMQVVEYFQSHAEVELEVAAGHAHLREESQRPLILIAGGTGFSYVRAILRRALKLNPDRAIQVFWGGKDPSALYLHQEMLALAAKHPNLAYRPVVEHKPADFDGLQGLVLDKVKEFNPDLSGFDIYIAGRFEMAAVARDLFLAHGAVSDNLFGDAFAFI
ncbi:NAD(P)H-flavin reductase [Gallaecimonas pentaromativorans]|uniref:Aquacobalamin reductase/NAD(P)H-flavin reductase n=1 Tax=Gallaecimonas pentaromativorans TaxID=584787 RepID=A0A3N1PBL0_9GAMM|nr:NAD(P)H-flavin reductase [Gallaecimonas pentaromativorans]ROQ24387.1 aquacobalamin reductase/NAD(P)H-flavin reductase [Gallaecimonas pentaromativorans]